MKPKAINFDAYTLGQTKRLFVVAEQEVVLTNVLERLGHFYNFHLDADGCLEPAARILNPEIRGVRLNPDDDMWFLPFYKGYRVHIIRQHRGFTGPHPVRLYYKSQQLPYLYWLATLQITNVMFFDEGGIVTSLKQAIVNKEFYIAPHSRKDVVAK